MIATLSRAGALTKLVAGAICVRTSSRSIRRVRAVVMGMGRLRRGNARNLLSDHLGFVVCLDLEAAVVGPEVNGNADASDAALVDLAPCQLASCLLEACSAHHLCRLSPGNRKFQVCISLPESVEQGVSCEKTVVSLACGCDRLRAGIAVESTFLCFSCADQLLPVLEFLRVGCLCVVC